MNTNPKNISTECYHEFFKLDNVDQKVALWIVDNLNGRGIKSWIEFIAVDYNRRKGIKLDTEKLYQEIMS